MAHFVAVISDRPNLTTGTGRVVSTVLRLKGTHYRFGLGYVAEGEEGRKVYQGPMVAGPWAYAFGLCSVLAANPMDGTYGDNIRLSATGLLIEVEAGDTIEIAGTTYTVEAERREFINLV